jgi:hypothetical protein
MVNLLGSRFTDRPSFTAPAHRPGAAHPRWETTLRVTGSVLSMEFLDAAGLLA